MAKKTNAALKNSVAAQPIDRQYSIDEMEQIRKDHNLASTKSAMIRYLGSIGVKTGNIAKSLNIRYQHARNVLTQLLKTTANTPEPKPEPENADEDMGVESEDEIEDEIEGSGDDEGTPSLDE